MESSYVKAIETRMDWLKWGIDEGVQAWRGKGIKYIPGLQSYLKCLEASETFFMNRRFCSLVDNARSTIPDDLVFESAWLQAPQGWMWLEDPFIVPFEVFDTKGQVSEALGGLEKEEVGKLKDFKMRISAIGWIPVQEGYKTADYMNTNKPGRVAGKGAFQFLCFQDYAHYSGSKGHGFGCWSYFMLQDGDKLIDRIHQFEEQAKEEGGGYSDERARDMLHEIRWIYAAIYLMAQRLAITVKHDTDRATKRRALHENRVAPNNIKVISLRRFEEEKKHAEITGKAIDWQWQWMVRGHWRNQYYPSSGEYKPVFIESFIKGPQDKPLKPESINVFVARR